MDKWKEEEVFEEVEDLGQEKISTTWVITEKMIDGRMVTKARLVARGYEENDCDIKSDSPTCMKDSIRMVLAFASALVAILCSFEVRRIFHADIGNIRKTDIFKKIAEYPESIFAGAPREYSANVS